MNDSHTKRVIITSESTHPGFCISRYILSFENEEINSFYSPIQLNKHLQNHPEYDISWETDKPVINLSFKESI